MIRAMYKLHVRPRALPMFCPRGVVHIPWPVAHLYDDIFVARIYEPPIAMPDAPRIIDAGAHVGFASIFFLNRFPKASVTSFEPNPTTCGYLRKNVAKFGSRSTVISKALSTRSGKAKYFITEDNPTNVTGGLENREGMDRKVKFHEIECANILDYLIEPVDFLKLDIEGEEYNILRLEEINPERVKSLAVEFHDISKRHPEFVEVVELLRHRGYHWVDIRGRRDIDPGEIRHEGGERCGSVRNSIARQT